MLLGRRALTPRSLVDRDPATDPRRRARHHGECSVATVHRRVPPRVAAPDGPLETYARREADPFPEQVGDAHLERSRETVQSGRGKLAWALLQVLEVAGRHPSGCRELLATQPEFVAAQRHTPPEIAWIRRLGLVASCHATIMLEAGTPAGLHTGPSSAPALLTRVSHLASREIGRTG
jgi:hypothetical protein